MTETPAQIAARLGMPLAPNARLTVVPMGVSGMPQPVWNGRDLVLPGWKDHLEAARGAQVRAARIARQDAARAGANGPTPREVKVARVREMVSLGHDRAAIMAETGMSAVGLGVFAFKNQIVLPAPVSLAKAPKAPRAKTPRKSRAIARPPDPAIEARRAAVRDLYLAGMAWRDIAARLGITINTICNDVKKMGLTRDRRPGDPLHPDRLAQAARHREEIRAGIAAGESNKRMALRLGLARATVSRIRCDLTRAAAAGEGVAA